MGEVALHPAPLASSPEHRLLALLMCRPQLPSRPRSAASQLKTSEEFDLERAEGEAEAAAALRRRNAEGVRRVLQPPPPAVAHSSRPLTQPVALELHTFKRRRMHSMSTRSMVGGLLPNQLACKPWWAVVDA